MRLGCTTIINATHCSSEKTAKQQFLKYKALAKRYGYKIWYLDVDVPIEQALARNRVRGIDKNTRFLDIKRALWINQDKYPLSITKKITKTVKKSLTQ